MAVRARWGRYFWLVHGDKYRSQGYYKVERARLAFESKRNWVLRRT